MEVRRRSKSGSGEPLRQLRAVKASDALPLPLHLTNSVFILLFFSVAYFLLLRWGEKIRNSTPIRLVSSSELTALVAFSASVIYLLGFFGISFVQPKPSPTANRTLDRFIIRSLVELMEMLHRPSAP